MTSPSNMNIDGLIPMQDSLRDYNAIEIMRHFVCEGGIFTLQALEEHHEWLQVTRPARLIAIAKFEDNALFIRDGHHRVLSIWLADRDHLFPEEYSIEQWRYEDFGEISETAFNKGFVTPFDPRTHVRWADLHEYKKDLSTEWHLAKQEIRKAWANEQYLQSRSCHSNGFRHIQHLSNGLKRGCSGVET